LAHRAALERDNEAVDFDFTISSWAAYAPGLELPEQWQRWASGKPCALPAGSAVPDLVEMPALARRRLDPLGRMAVQVAWWCERGDLGMPKVFASRYGDAARSLALLGDAVRGEPLSPTAFGLSVHNAIGALYSIARGDVANYTSVAAGPASAAAGIVEAVGLLADGTPEVLVVCYDQPLPGEYACFEDEPSAPYAWAWRVRLAAADAPCIRLSASPGAASTAPPALPFGLDVLRFALSGDAVLERAVGTTAWTWRRRDG
jgi:hypothetical protein